MSEEQQAKQISSFAAPRRRTRFLSEEEDPSFHTQSLHQHQHQQEEEEGEDDDFSLSEEEVENSSSTFNRTTDRQTTLTPSSSTPIDNTSTILLENQHSHSTNETNETNEIYSNENDAFALEEEIGLHETMLESLHSKLMALQKEIEKERKTLKQHQDNTTKLQQKQDQLRQSRDTNTNRSIPLLTLLQAQEEAIAGTSFDKDKDSLTRVDIIATIVNLACAEENKNKLLYHPGLLEAVLAVAKEDHVKEAREHAAIAIMNLALADPNKQFLANRDDLLEALIKLFDDSFSFTRRYASATIFTLSCLPINTKRLIEFSNYQIITALSKLLGYDQDEEVRVNAAKTIFQLTRNDEPYMVEGMILNSDILPCLAQTVISDYSADVRAYSARALEWMAADIYAPSPCHHRLLTALAKASAWTKTSCIAEALKNQSTFSVNRRTMAEHDQVLDALAMLASLDGVNDSEAQECALIAIENLTMEESTRGIMAGHEGVMTALTRATFKKSEFEEYENDPSTTKSALKNLAAHITFDE